MLHMSKYACYTKLMQKPKEWKCKKVKTMKDILNKLNKEMGILISIEI